MKKVRLFSLLLSAVLVLGLLAGCGGNAPASAETPASSLPEPASEAPAPAPEPEPAPEEEPSAAEPAAEPEAPAEPEEPSEPEEPGAPAISNEPVSADLGDYHITIVAAEEFTDIDGKAAIRFYYDFTNNSDDLESAWVNLDYKASQEGYELVST